MTENHAPFTPDWVIPPGETILDFAQEKGWSQGDLARRLGYSQKHLSQLIHGKVPLTVDAARRLETVLGSTVDFWLTLEANYQKDLTRIAQEKQHAEWVPWLESLPLKDLMTLGHLPKTRVDQKSKPGLVGEALRLFGVASPDEWTGVYGNMQFQFRRSTQRAGDLGAVATWLRLGEISAESQHLDQNFDRTKFIHALQNARKLTLLPVEEALPLLRGLMHGAGVHLVCVPAIKNAHVSGVARWLSPSRPLIQLSFYGKTNDKFWFSFAHEAAHILLHAKSSKDTQSIFLDDHAGSQATDPREIEANDWASEWLIPNQFHQEMYALPHTREAVRTFSERVQIHPGIVVGRLQFEKRLRQDWLNNLKETVGPCA